MPGTTPLPLACYLGPLMVFARTGVKRTPRGPPRFRTAPCTSGVRSCSVDSDSRSRRTSQTSDLTAWRMYFTLHRERMPDFVRVYRTKSADIVVTGEEILHLLPGRWPGLQSLCDRGNSPALHQGMMGRRFRNIPGFTSRRRQDDEAQVQDRSRQGCGCSVVLR